MLYRVSIAVSNVYRMNESPDIKEIKITKEIEAETYLEAIEKSALELNQLEKL